MTIAILAELLGTHVVETDAGEPPGTLVGVTAHEGMFFFLVRWLDGSFSTMRADEVAIAGTQEAPK